MNDDEKHVIYESKLEDGTTYEIISALPSWDLTKYILSHFDLFDKAIINKEILDDFDRIIKECFRGWRIGNEGNWNNEVNAIPGAVLLSYLARIIRQAGVKVETVIKTKKN